MKRMGVLLVLGALMSVARAELWDDNFAKAMDEAKASGKYVLLDFTGSDWCGWCKKLDAEVFSKKEFKKFAKEQLVCVTVDFPQSKPQSNKLKKQNRELSDRYHVSGYPTIVLLNPEGEPVGKTGYKPGGPDPYIADLQAMIERDRQTKKAAK